MPSSIDPVDNMFGTGVSLLQRILITFAAGWTGNFVSRFCASIDSGEDVLRPIEIMNRILGEFGAAEALGFVLWPIVVIYYLAKVPIYGLLIIPFLLTGVVRIIVTDDPVLFWALLIVFLLAPGMVFSDGNLWSAIPLAFFLVGLGAGLWWAVRYEHAHWFDEVKIWFGKD